MVDQTPVSAVTIEVSKDPIFSPTRFINNIRPTRRVHFKVEITLPQFLMEKYDANKLTLTAVSTNIPTVSIKNTSVRRGTVSYEEAFPTNISFGDLSITFYSDMEGQTLTMFKDWVDYIFPTDMNADGRFSVPYKADYAAQVDIRHYDAEGRVIILYNFEDVYPVNIADIPLNWGGFNDIVTLSADFKYSKYTVENRYDSSTQGNQKYRKDTSVLNSSAQNNLLPIISKIRDAFNRIF
jgi:hypothetical protein